jgi:hypothetical protein
MRLGKGKGGTVQISKPCLNYLPRDGRAGRRRKASLKRHQEHVGSYR